MSRRLFVNHILPTHLQGFAAAAELGTPTLDALRREMEAADSVSGIFLYHSLAGGTGSGLGSAITQVMTIELLFRASFADCADENSDAVVPGSQR
jgi:hypothetical protein